MVEMLSDSSSSFDESNEDDSDFPDEFGPPIHRSVVRMKRYVEDCIDKFDYQQFRENFRISRTTFEYLLDSLNLQDKLPAHSYGREKITPKHALLITIWYLANMETFRQISDRFNVSRSAAHTCINKVVSALVDISGDYIKWPSREESTDIVENFKTKQNVNHVIGAIDGCHINIKKPKREFQLAYCNRKGNHSILLQAVCDHNKRFIDIFCGEPGSVHDARVLKKSNIFKVCSVKKLNNLVILGDSAYPNLEWLVPPFKNNGNLSDLQKNFNYRHSATRVIIENSFGLLKGRFRRLKYFENLKIPFIVKSIIAACIIHNICINLDDLDIDYEVEDENNDLIENENLEFEVGRDRRLEIFNEVYNLN